MDHLDAKEELAVLKGMVQENIAKLILFKQKLHKSGGVMTESDNLYAKRLEEESLFNIATAKVLQSKIDHEGID